MVIERERETENDPSVLGTKSLDFILNLSGIVYLKRQKLHETLGFLSFLVYFALYVWFLQNTEEILSLILRNIKSIISPTFSNNSKQPKKKKASQTQKINRFIPVICNFAYLLRKLTGFFSFFSMKTKIL